MTRLTAILLFCVSLHAAEPRRAGHLPSGPVPDPGGVLHGLAIASLGGAGQTTIQALATDADGNVYAAGSTTALDFPIKNAAQPNLAESRIMRSTDLGATWTRAGSPPQDVSIVLSDPASAQVLFAAGAAGIYKSVDAGQTWRTVYPYPPAAPFSPSLVIDPANRLRLAAIEPSRGLVIRSFDNGESWLPASTACPSAVCGGQLYADPGGTGTLFLKSANLFISRDWGASFQALPMGAAVIAFDPSHPGWIYADRAAGVKGTLFLSTDYGATWTQKASPSSTFSNFLSLAVDPAHPNILVATTVDGLWQSTDGAASWNRIPASSLSIAGGLTFAPPGCGSALFALGGSGTYSVASSRDDGLTWSAPALGHVTSIAAGTGCAVYITRTLTSDAFLAKFAPDGTLIWCTLLGGFDADMAVAVALDEQRNVYITGNTASPDFPATQPPIGVAGQNAVFATKFSNDGRLLYSTILSGEASQTAIAIAVDSAQNAYIAGGTDSLKFPATPGALGTTVDAGSYTGFLAKLGADGTLANATYLGSSYTLVGALALDATDQPVVAAIMPPPAGNPGQAPTIEFVEKLDRSLTQITRSATIPGATPYVTGPTALAIDNAGNLIVYGSSMSDLTPTPGAYSAPLPVVNCGSREGSVGNAYVIKLAAADWSPVFTAMLRAPCGIEAGPMVLDNSGAILVGMSAGAGMPLQSPLLGGPSCSYTTAGVAKLSADGSTLRFATYLDSCGVPALAAAPDGSIYAGVTPPVSTSSPAGILHLNPTSLAVSLDGIVNAFGGVPTAVAGGGLYTLGISGFQPPAIDLGLNAAQGLPFSLGGVQVSFDGVPAAILQTAPGRVIVAAPYELPADRHTSAARPFTSIQVIANGVRSNVVRMPVAAYAAGLLTRIFPAFQPFSFNGLPDGYVRNADNSLNDADHPAALGSTITLFATGVGANSYPIIPGAIAHSTSIVALEPIYTSWDRGTPLPVTPKTASTVPGFVSSMFQIAVPVPTSIQNLFGTPLPNGVTRIALNLIFTPFSSSAVPAASNTIAVYVK